MLDSDTLDKYFKEGPTYVPEHYIKIEAHTTCAMCKYYQHRMIKSGRDPVYAERCEHPEAEIKPTSWGSNLERDPYHQFVITPEWCPFLNKSNGI